MNFTPEITTGNLLTIAAFVFAVIGGFYGLRGRLDVVTALMAQHNSRVERMEQRHEQRLTKLEDNDYRLTVMVQQLIGKTDERSRWDGAERRNDEGDPRRR